MPSAMSNGTNHTGEEVGPLRVVCIGGGIGGLTAAIALRQQGHDVIVLEQWDGANETGAAVHLAPNANGILRRLGLYAETFGANGMNRLTDYSTDGTRIRSIDLTGANKMWQHPWQLVHRVGLHSQLRKTAVSTEGKGKPVEVRYSSKVVSVDPDTATAVLESGERIEGDALLGADGVMSQARKSVKGGHIVPFSSGKSAFRFIVPAKDALADPVTRKFAEGDGELLLFLGQDRKIVCYPCQNNELLNFVCIHPDTETAAPADDWNAGGNKAKLLEVYSMFDDSARALLSKADPKSLKVWKLLDMDKLPTWTNNKLTLLGDAAHPFLPHQGQGAGVAMEDAAALAVVLPLGTKPSEVADRLLVYESCRYERAHRIQEYTRIAGRDLGEPGNVDSE